MIMKARFDGRVFVPEQPVDLPPGSVVEFSVPRETTTQAGRPHVRLADLAKRFPIDPDLPTDGAEQHDHYLYGTPKRENP